VSADKGQALLNVVRTRLEGNMPAAYVKLKGLDETALYRENATGMTYRGSALMEAGLVLPMNMIEYAAYQMSFERVEE